MDKPKYPDSMLRAGQVWADTDPFRGPDAESFWLITKVEKGTISLRRGDGPSGPWHSEYKLPYESDRDYSTMTDKARLIKPGQDYKECF